MDGLTTKAKRKDRLKFIIQYLNKLRPWLVKSG
jgi:hypothetical protein